MFVKSRNWKRSKTWRPWFKNSKTRKPLCKILKLGIGSHCLKALKLGNALKLGDHCSKIPKPGIVLKVGKPLFKFLKLKIVQVENYKGPKHSKTRKVLLENSDTRTHSNSRKSYTWKRSQTRKPSFENLKLRNILKLGNHCLVKNS